jgi:hypothetical protein
MAARPSIACGSAATDAADTVLMALGPVEMAREGVPLNIIQRELGRSNLGTRSTSQESTTPRSSRRSVPRRAPMIPVSASLRH